ncbi:related to sulfide:quinone oxidoreductase, mitochondrial precursor [Melanopsichium pennsylvanicum]|uniref:Related to sulfide:quinone oxidoreductase, mitochondrial n=2 Tax=Melanopsichium pennsylvanicum TaxID=63383 RepID=A0AAJ4XI74_9BASI|nr:related to sulfide:quinone oxidoreductase, mitochondrial precursor [Melanopsichium pennsylvanicum 4]SNX82585.1 related to sulfide:quinone oxidoreductase, mitochondrial precursor [Melanopsichium pennsylvanicum]
MHAMLKKSLTATARASRSCYTAGAARTLATVSDSPVQHTASGSSSHKVVIIGGGSAGMAVSHQLIRSGAFSQDDIAVVDPSEWHHYQPGWTLVGGGLKDKRDLRRPLASLLDSKLRHYTSPVDSFAPEQNHITLANGNRIAYDQLVVVPGLSINYDQIKGLPEALQDSSSLVSTIYGYNTCDKVFDTINKLKSGKAIFTQPAGVIKCAGAPQKAMWLALDHWKKAGLYNPTDSAKSAIKIDFATGLPVMFGVPKYSEKLNELRKQRGVEGLFEHDLVAIEGNEAVFARPGGAEQVRKQFDLLHVTPKMGPLAVIKNSALADGAGFVDVDQGSTRHKRFDNIWSIGDASSLPTSKTAAAITAEAPVLVRNLAQALEGKEADAVYDGYTSCPLLTEYGKVMLAEFKYGGQPKETFGNLFGIDQSEPRKAFYHLKKDFFPWVYYNSYVKGTWSGPKGFSFSAAPISPEAVAGKRSFSTNASRGFPVSRRSFSTTTVGLRNTPARRPRDPLDASPDATRHTLPSGETFIVRPPPTASPVRTTVYQAQPLLSAVPTNDTSNLPPALRPRSKLTQRSDAITSEQIATIQRLRKEDPITYTKTKLAKKFKCSPLFVSIVAPLPESVKMVKKQQEDLKKASWGLNKRVARAEREERRLLW